MEQQAARYVLLDTSASLAQRTPLLSIQSVRRVVTATQPMCSPRALVVPMASSPAAAVSPTPAPCANLASTAPPREDSSRTESSVLQGHSAPAAMDGRRAVRTAPETPPRWGRSPPTPASPARLVYTATTSVIATASHALKDTFAPRLLGLFTTFHVLLGLTPISLG